TSKRCRCRHLLGLLRRLAEFPRAARPEGSLRPCGRGMHPYPPHYRAAFACSPVLYPQPHRLASRLTFPRREGYGLTTLHRRNLLGLGPASTPVARHLRRGSSETPGLATYLLVQAFQQL